MDIKIVVIGIGEVGFNLTKTLSKENYDITAIDISPEKCQRIKNSIDAIEKENGKVIISMYKNKENIIIDFLDNGNGINRRNKRNIFKPGYSTKTRGWGLGLSLTKRIIENIHKGDFLLPLSN